MAIMLAILLNLQAELLKIGNAAFVKVGLMEFKINLQLLQLLNISSIFREYQVRGSYLNY